MPSSGSAISNKTCFGAVFFNWLCASNTNANEIYVGVLNIWKSVDGGDSFTQVNSWTTRNDSYTHADIHFIRDLENGLYVGSDGGVFKSTDGGSLFTDLTV